MVYTFRVVVTVLISLIMMIIVVATYNAPKNIKRMAILLFTVEALSIVAIWGQP